MGFWIFMLIMDLLLPFTMIGFGRYFMKKAPKEINSVFVELNPKSIRAQRRQNPLRKRLTNIFNETSKPSSFCCLPIITIGVVDYRHCNQKNLKIYLSTLHKSVQMHIKWEYILKFRSFCDRISLLKSVQMHGNGKCNDGD